MTHQNSMDDSALALALRQLYLAEVDRARHEPQSALVAVRGGVQARAKAWSPLVAAALVLVLGVAAVGSQLGRGAPSPVGPESANPGGGASATRSLTPSAEASASLIGPIVGGIPETIGGEPVLRGTDAIRQRIERSTDDSSFLVGGWFHKGGLRIFCPAVLSRMSLSWWPCSTVQLYEQARGDEQHQGTSAVWIYPGDPRRIDPGTAIAAVRPVVLRIHTHDSSCTAEVQDCNSLPVLLELVWIGPAA